MMAESGSAPVPLKSKRCTLERAEKFISDAYFTDCNLYGKLFLEKHPVRITHRKANGRVTFGEATQAWNSGSSKSKYPAAEVVKPGSSYGPTWATHWFRIQFQIPKAWNKKEVHLLWNSNSEAMVWSPSGEPLQGLNKDDRTSFILTRPHSSLLEYEHLYIEMACNKILGAGNGLIDAPILDSTFTLSQAELALFNRDAYDLMMDVEILVDMVKYLPEDRERGYQALYTVNRMMNACSADQPETYQAARDICRKFLEEKNGDSAHTIHAIANAHIDSAWLWPYAETKRKVARTWSNVLSLAKDYPDLNFAFSQAQQFQWVKSDYPSLYRKIQELAKRGRFIPVGGCWVEMDGNLPSGESFVRQVLYGQRFFKEEFGSYCTEYWLPDTFGYSAQLPQILAAGGMRRFVTQKMSWCIVNKFPHNTFWWQGIDGTKCLAHFPPTDTYHARVKVEECLKNATNHRDKGRSDHSLMLYGFGDGGGGPTKDMLERMQRLKDVDGIPRVKPSTPKEFFSSVEKDGGNLCTWQGELYLELHQGTFTTQAEIKYLNRKLEHKLQQTEFLSALQPVGKEALMQETISEKWKRLLLHQFHDVLPGSCIREVVEDAVTDMKALSRELDLEKIILINSLSQNIKRGKSSSVLGSKVICNHLSWERTEVIDLGQGSMSNTSGSGGDSPTPAKKARKVGGGSEKVDNFAMVTIPAMSVSTVLQCTPSSTPVPAQIEAVSNGYKLWNEHLVALVDSCGRLTQMNLSKPGGIKPVYQKPDVIPDGDNYGNQFVMFDDVPLFWDAWDVMDYHLETRKPVNECTSIEVVETNPLQVSLKVELKISDRSYIEQKIILRAHSKYLEFHTKVHWDESHKFLKVEFPVNVHSPEATFDIQYGHLKRPTHQNTSWDWARYEVVGHKWIDLSQYDWGVAILNDCKYGHSVIKNVMRISLLRSPKKPDPEADIGDHVFSYAIMPHTGTYQSAGVIQAAYEFNNPLTPMPMPTDTTLDLREIFTIAPSSVIIESVKKSEDANDCVVVRCYEAYGGEVLAKLTTKLEATKFSRCNFLEDEDADCDGFLEEGQSSVCFRLTPFQIATIKIQLKPH
ncbi:alpha-mannosidase 2C1-like [Lytechinus pictus]|uniref:alpha-mannosidase 2C1-like n=1 Tax=Lytechinus pictus TaxID=7653 RepID=UPI0030B9BA96